MSVRRFFRSGGFLISIAERRLSYGATPIQMRTQMQIQIQPRCFDAMTYLILNRHRAVGRDELVSAVWGKVTLSPSALSQCILRLRQTLSVSPELSEAIRTVSRHGYQWVAPVEMWESD
jgi:DNA-binding winged helix-turn-helix (wHTH) protein